VRAENHDLSPLRDGGVYLLFLKKSVEKTPGVYAIHNAAAFEISGDAVRALANHGADLFRDFSASHDQVVARIVAAVRAR
jgi:hypothetical protein